MDEAHLRRVASGRRAHDLLRHWQRGAARVDGVRRPGPAERGLLTEFKRRYARIGMSPLIGITQQQAAALANVLGSESRVSAGMRFSEPSIATAVGELGNIDRVLGLILSPQYSATLMGGYHQA